MTLRMLDSITPANLPPGADAYLGYTGGHWPTFGALQRMFPRAHLLSTAVFASDDADCLDVETGDATVAQIYGWFKRQQARKVWRPVIYSSVSNIDHIVATMTANGFQRSEYRLLSAHYGAGEHICGPHSCGQARADCDGTQWTDRAPGNGGSLIDESLLSGAFFGANPAPRPSPPPAPAPDPAPQPLPSPEASMVELDTTIASHPLLIPFGTATMDLLSVNTEADPCVVEVTFLHQGADARQYSLSWGTADTVGSGIEVPAGIKKARIDIVSGGGLPLGVRFNAG